MPDPAARVKDGPGQKTHTPRDRSRGAGGHTLRHEFEAAAAPSRRRSGRRGDRLAMI